MTGEMYSVAVVLRWALGDRGIAVSDLTESYIYRVVNSLSGTGRQAQKRAGSWTRSLAAHALSSPPET